MGKLVTYIFVVVVILLGLPNMSTCIGFALERSGVIGGPTSLNKEDLSEKKDGYTITYTLNEGSLTDENPSTYGLFTSTFTLNNPTKKGYEFTGWTGSNGDVPQLTITIYEGSCGDLEFTANYALILGTPDVEIENNIITWNAIENATGYVVNVNGVDVETVSELTYNLRNAKTYLIDGINVVKVKASADGVEGHADGAYSAPVNYSATSLAIPSLSSDEFNITWNAIENAVGYNVSIGAYTVETTDTSINLLNYLNMLSASGKTNIRVQAVAPIESEYINSEYSVRLEFVKPKLKAITLKLENELLTWNDDSRVEEYDIIVGNEVVQTIAGKTELDIKELNSFFADGKNSITVRAKSRGYDSAISNSLNYVYYDTSNFDNLTIKVKFSRLSDRFRLHEVSQMYIEYSFTGQYLSSMFDQHAYDSTLQPDMNFLQVINPNSNVSTLSLSNCTLFELIEEINGMYNGEDILTLNISDKLLFTLNDTLKTKYSPSNITLEVKYTNMYTEPLFYEGCSLDLGDLGNNNLYLIDKVFYGEPYRANMRLFLTDTDNQTLCFSLTYNHESGETEGVGIYTVPDNSFADMEPYSMNFATFTALNKISGMKFKLNSSYYLKFVDDDLFSISTGFAFSAFLSKLTSEIYEHRKACASTEGVNIKSFTKEVFGTDNLVNQYFKVYSFATDEEVTFNYNLTMNYSSWLLA